MSENVSNEKVNNFFDSRYNFENIQLDSNDDVKLAKDIAIQLEELDNDQIRYFYGKVNNNILLKMNFKSENFVKLLRSRKYDDKLMEIYNEHDLDLSKAFENIGITKDEELNTNDSLNEFNALDFIDNKDIQIKNKARNILAEYLDSNTDKFLIEKLIPYADFNVLKRMYKQSNHPLVQKILKLNNNEEFQLYVLNNIPMPQEISIILNNTKFNSVLLKISMYKYMNKADIAQNKLKNV